MRVHVTLVSISFGGLWMLSVDGSLPENWASWGYGPAFSYSSTQKPGVVDSSQCQTLGRDALFYNEMHTNCICVHCCLWEVGKWQGWRAETASGLESSLQSITAWVWVDWLSLLLPYSPAEEAW